MKRYASNKNKEDGEMTQGLRLLDALAEGPEEKK